MKTDNINFSPLFSIRHYSVVTGKIVIHVKGFEWSPYKKLVG